MSEYLEDLAREILHSYSLLDRRIELEIDIEEVFLLIDTAIPCGMVLSELLSNSLQHAFPDVRRKGAIGMQSVTAIVETQLQGRTEFHGSPGVRWEIHFSDDNYWQRIPNG